VIEEVSTCRKAFQYLYQITNEPISTERSDQYQQRKFNPDPLKNHSRNQPDPNPLKANDPHPLKAAAPIHRKPYPTLEKL
jgi:hypothetical protein